MSFFFSKNAASHKSDEAAKKTYRIRRASAQNRWSKIGDYLYKPWEASKKTSLTFARWVMFA
jgi:hypothetical protein